MSDDVFFNQPKFCTTSAVAIGIFKLSSPYGKASANVQDNAPNDNVPILAFGSIINPTNDAETKHPKHPDAEAPLVSFVDGTEDPIHDATGSATAKHSTAYLATSMSTVRTVTAVPKRK